MPQNLPFRKNPTVPDGREFNVSQVGASIVGGLAAAAAFALITKGTMSGLLLAHLAPLPIMIVALGFGLRHGVTTALVSVVLLSIWPHPLFGFSYAFLVAVPAMTAAFVAMGAPFRGRVWLTERLPAWTALSAAAALIAAASVAMAAAAYSAGGVEEALSPLRARAFIIMEDIIRSQNLGDRFDAKELSGALARAFPAMIAAYTLLVLMLDLWAAGRLAKLSGLLTREWPDIATEFVLPRAVSAVFAASAGMAFLEGFLGELGLIVAMTLGLALALQGLAVTHALTRGMKSSAIVLGVIYFVLGVLGWPIVFFTVVGLADAAFSFRIRKTVERRG